MTRSYRWNLEYAATAEPERCQHCRELAATVELVVQNVWGGERSYAFCDDCMALWEQKLKDARLFYAVVRLNTGED